MKKRWGVLPFIVLLSCVFGCETETQIADRVLKKRESFKSVTGCEIVSLTDEPYRTTTIVLSDGRKIVIESGKHRHETKVLDEASR